MHTCSPCTGSRVAARQWLHLSGTRGRYPGGQHFLSLLESLSGSLGTTGWLVRQPGMGPPATFQPCTKSPRGLEIHLWGPGQTATSLPPVHPH